MSIGSNIRFYRKLQGFTQEELAEELEVTFQAVSSWENDEYTPELKKFIKLTEVLKVPATSIIEDKSATFNTKEAIYDWEHMKTFVKTTARNLQLTNTLSALGYAVWAHEGMTRNNSEIPYVVHPLNMACHALAMGIKEDEIIAAILLHDTVEDCKKKGVTLESLPVNDETKELVRLMTKVKIPGEDKTVQLDRYYSALAKNPKAALIKCIDRCNNMTTMSWGMDREGIYRYIDEVDTYYPALLKAVKDTPEYNDAAWLLKYHIESMLDIYKRLM